jgi:hypothetical protein
MNENSIDRQPVRAALVMGGLLLALSACTGGTPEAGRISGDTVSAGNAAGGISGAPPPAYVDTGGSALNPGGVVPTDTAHQRMTNMGPGREQAPPTPGTTPRPNP